MSVTAVLITREASYPRDIKIDFPFDEVLIETDCPNVLRRFELAEKASSDIIYVQDDDAEIDIHALWSHYNGHLTNAMSEFHLQAYAGTGVTLVGWGAFFPKSVINFEPWQKRYGAVDEMEADRIFTYFARPHNSILMPIREVRRSVRMSARVDHYSIRDSIIRQLKDITCVCQ